jgi:hypothetical protein
VLEEPQGTRGVPGGPPAPAEVAPGGPPPSQKAGLQNHFLSCRVESKTWIPHITCELGFSAAHARPGHHPPRRGMPLIRVNLPANSSRNGPKARECATLPGGFKGRGVYRAAHQHLLKRHREGHLPHRKRSDGPASKLSLLVEVGSFPGQGSCVMAQLLLATPKAERARLRFHVVDRFGGLQSFQSAQSAARQAIHRHGSSYAAWSANMIETGSITGIDQVSRASSVDGSLLLQYANESVAFMYLDTSHLDRLTRCARCPAAKEIACMRRELRDCMHVPATVNSYPPREILCRPDGIASHLHFQAGARRLVAEDPKRRVAVRGRLLSPLGTPRSRRVLSASPGAGALLGS